MKSAEEFLTELKWRWKLDSRAIAAIKARDLEMWKQGMTDAAVMVDAARETACTGFRELREQITRKRDQTKTV